MAAKSHPLPYGLAVFLVFSTKMLLIDIFRISVLLSLGMLASVLSQ